MTNSAPIALVGAYERDNFGDLLFLELTRLLLKPAATVPTAPTTADVSELIDGSGEIEAYWPILGAGGARALWVVGGEVGGTSMESALAMSGMGSDIARPMTRWSSPYLPRPSLFERSATIPLVVNSVGVTGIAGLKGSRRIEAVAALREADFISVREAKSAAVLRAAGISHRVAPDLVQALPLIVKSPSNRTMSDPYAIFQMKDKWITRLGAEAVADALGSSLITSAYRLVLLPAGLAPGHDSLASYEYIRARLSRVKPHLDIEIFSNSNPFEKATLISNADLFVGTSLHGHVISSAFGVPRVSLLLEKVRTYAESWEDTAPSGVALERLHIAVDKALNVCGTEQDRSRGMELANLARANAVEARNALAEAAGDVGRAVSRSHSNHAVTRARRRVSTRVIDLASLLRHRRR